MATVTRQCGVTAAKGFAAAGIAAGIKKTGEPDLAMVVNTGPECTAAGVFTSNVFQAAPVLWSQRAVADGQLRAVILNSGGANACTGPQGDTDAQTTAESVARALSTHSAYPQLSDLQAGDIGVCSTGVIGDLLPMDAVLSGVATAVSVLDSGEQAGRDAATAIMTTDTVAKVAEYHSSEGWSLGGMVKGAGMIAPSLATMLCVLTTDAVVSSAHLDDALRQATRYTFDRLDVDGATSTNDTVFLLANGACGVSASPEELALAVRAVCDDLAEQMMSDAEGVTKCCIVRVTDALTEEEALCGARTVARDNLVKTALFGEDPNWGRVVAALGAAPIQMSRDHVAVAFNGHTVFREGQATADARSLDMSGSRITVDISLGVGSSSASIRTTDLSHAYVDINSAYTT